MTSQRQDRAIRLAHLRNRHLTATETAVNTVGSHNRRIHPKTVRNWSREFGLRACRRFATQSGMSRTWYGLGDSTSVTIRQVASIKLKWSSIELSWSRIELKLSSIELSWSSIKLKLSSIKLKWSSIELKLLSIELKWSSIKLSWSSIELSWSSIELSQSTSS